MNRRAFAKNLSALPLVQTAVVGQQRAVETGLRRELFVDRELVAELRGVELRPGNPIDRGYVLRFDKPWEGAFCGYTTVLKDGGRFLAYYRGLPVAGQDGSEHEVTCVAESRDGVTWHRPDLGIYQIDGTRNNNVILANNAPYSHNFTPFLDLRPGVDSGMRFKALSGIHRTGLTAFVSEDGLRWNKLREESVFPAPREFSLDSQNIAFWSAAEQKYVLYYRTWKQIGKTRYRWVSRAVSDDFLRWTPEGEMTYGEVPPEHLYTNQTSSYFRAPHIYTGICARFMPGRQVLQDDEAKNLNVDPKYYKDCSDAVLITSRGGRRYTRQFMEAFLRPGVGLENWVSRSNYPALNLVQTSPTRMSFYVNRNYGQPTACLSRYELRLDGLASAHAGYFGGEVVTKPLTFAGSALELNYSTSAAGSVRVELQDAAGNALPGYSLNEALELTGDQIERDYSWKTRRDVSELRGKSVRLRFVLKDADLFAFRFRPERESRNRD